MKEANLPGQHGGPQFRLKFGERRAFWKRVRRYGMFVEKDLELTRITKSFIFFFVTEIS